MSKKTFEESTKEINEYRKPLIDNNIPFDDWPCYRCGKVDRVHKIAIWNRAEHAICYEN